MKNNYWKFLLIILTGITCILSCEEQNPSEDEKTGGLTDYSQTENWMKLGNQTNYDVDVFYYYPTAYYPSKEYHELYCPVDHASMHKHGLSIYDQQARFFEGFTNIYVPWYRQADCLQLVGKSDEDIKSLVKAVPYQDAEAAFDYYIQHYNQGRPFILAGHSQGSIVLKLLFENYLKKHPELIERMIVAYPIGYSFETTYFEQNPHLKFAEGETDTRVIVTWNSERLEDGQFGQYNNICFPGALSINPVTWKHDYTPAPADDERFLGSETYPDIQCSVQVQYDPARDYEVLLLGIDTDIYDLDFIGDQSLHGLDVSLFGKNIRVNAQKRIEAYFQK